MSQVNYHLNYNNNETKQSHLEIRKRRKLSTNVGKITKRDQIVSIVYIVWLPLIIFFIYACTSMTTKFFHPYNIYH